MKQGSHSNEMLKVPHRRKLKNLGQKKLKRRFSDNPRINPLKFFPQDMPFRRSQSNYIEQNKLDQRKNNTRSNYIKKFLEHRTPIFTTTLKMFGALKDLLVLFLPYRISFKLARPSEFAFITSDIQRHFPLAKFLPDNFEFL